MTAHTGITIRKATADDAEFVVDCLVRMMQEAGDFGGHPIADEQTLRDAMTERWTTNYERQDRLFLIAEEESAEEERTGEASSPLRSLGVVSASVVQLPEWLAVPPSLHIHTLYVRAADARNRGIGNALLEEAFEWGKRNGCEEVELHVLEQNPARHLYERIGFHRFQSEYRRSI